MTIEYMLGFAVGGLVGVLIVAVLLKWTRTDKSKKCIFDERQELVRGRGFKYAFFALAMYNVLFGLLDLSLEKKIIEPISGIFIGLLISAGVHVCYCIWNEGYFALNENPKRLRIAFALLAITNIVLFMFEAVHGEVIEDGVLQFGITNLGCGIMFIAIFIVMFAKELSERGEKE